MNRETSVTCDVIKDLMPLYVDDVLSDDSRKLVSEHLKDCEDCRAFHEKLISADKSSEMALSAATAGENAKAKDTFKRIEKTIRTKRFRSIAITAILIVAIAAGAWYAVFVRQSYMPYEDCGIYIKDVVHEVEGEGKEIRKQAICTNAKYYGSYAFWSPDNETIFIFMTKTGYLNGSPSKDTVTEILHLGPEDLKVFDDETREISTAKEVYYLSEEDAKDYDFHYGYGWDESTIDLYRDMRNVEECKASRDAYIAANKEKVEEMKKASTLIWKADEYR